MVENFSELPANKAVFAYFSMEVGIDAVMPTYCGGLGILAGDTLRAAADLGLPMVAVTLLHRKGYFRQYLDNHGNQIEMEARWFPEEVLELLPMRVLVNIAGRQVQVQAWRHFIQGEFGHTIPVYFLDTALPENNPWDQALTDCLYGGDTRYRLCQEAVLGFGGVAMLRMLGHHRVQAYHMNEGHSAFVTLALLEDQTLGRGLSSVTDSDMEAVRKRCVFTTHTPVAAGHDRFDYELIREVLGAERSEFLATTQCCSCSVLNMSHLALCFSRYINGVSMRHEEISRSIFPNHIVNAITNGVHAVTWVSPPFRRVYDHYIPEWRRDNQYLRYAIKIPLDEIRRAHGEAKREMLAEVNRRTGACLDPAVLTIGFARRAVQYKRADLLFSDVNELKRIAEQVGPLQVVYAGKAHPRDEASKAVIRRIFEVAAALGHSIPIVYLEEYDIDLAKYVCSGVDVWLNTPLRPLEASGTSGMKAALNGVPSFSVLDGWWVEGHIENVTGWSIGNGWQSEDSVHHEVTSLYDKLERVIIPMFYKHPDTFANVMRSAIALNGSYFNAQRMVAQYLQNVYLRAGKTNGHSVPSQKTAESAILRGL
ncbi:MAG: alpha-glucan family phosphorylase [Chloroflexi bacterium]|nr:alpha-glucan family phosphorylase [Chloroflexota bacterium]